MTIRELNRLPAAEAREALERCCGSQTWVDLMFKAMPFENEEDLVMTAQTAWDHCTEEDGLEAFKHHPRIGGKEELAKKFASTATWASGEQSGVNTATDDVLQALADGNVAYEAKFGYIFIVCATGKSAPEMLEILESRLPNAPEDEIRIAMGEQMKITHIRLQKLLAS